MNLFSPAPEMVEKLQDTSLVSVARQPLAMGLLAGKFTGGTTFADDDIRARGPDWLAYFKDGQPTPELAQKLEAVRELLMSDGRSVVQGALAWIWARSPNTVPIPGIRTVAQAEENAAAVEKGPLSPETTAEIDQILGL